LQDFHESGLDKLGFVLNRAVKKTIITGKNHVLDCVTEVEKETGLPTSGTRGGLGESGAEVGCIIN